MLHVAVQNPLELHGFMKKFENTSGNAAINSVFSIGFIDPDVVVAYVALFESDYEHLGTFEPKLVKFFFTLLAELAPNNECSMPNFGRVQERQDKEANRHALRNLNQGAGYEDDDNSEDEQRKSRARRFKVFNHASMTKVMMVFDK